MRKGLLKTDVNGISVRTSHAQVVNELGKMIVAGSYPIGSTLPGDAELTTHFKVSRTVLREAMKTLAAKGLITPRARIGTRVAPNTQWNLFDSDILTWHFALGVNEDFILRLSDVRLAFEPHAAALAARHASEIEVSQMMRLAIAMGTLGHTADTLAKADLNFHMSVLEVSRNPFLRTIGSLIEAALIGTFKLSSPVTDRRKIDDVAVSHIHIVEQIDKRDEKGAREAMENVIRIGRDRVVRALREQA